MLEITEDELLKLKEENRAKILRLIVLGIVKLKKTDMEIYM